MEHHSIILELIEIENSSKNYENERLFIHIYEFYYINSYDSKDDKETFLRIIVDMIEIELKNCEKVDDLFNKYTLTQKILFSFLNKPPFLKYATINIRYPFFKILQELEYSDVEKLMDMKNVEKILDEIFLIFLNSLQKIPLIIKFFCYASLTLAQKKVNFLYSLNYINFYKFPNELNSNSKRNKFITNIFLVKWLLPAIMFQEYNQDDFIHSVKFENFLQIQSHLSSLIRFIFKGAENIDPYMKNYAPFIEKKKF